MTDSDFSRQSFLGPHAQQKFEQATVGIVGLGGGGSHVAQQLAHVGFMRYELFDPDVVEHSNLNRMIGATQADAKRKRLKVDIAKRLIKGLRPKAQVGGNVARWQKIPETVRGCDLIFGCVDGFQGRDELERICRRYFIPYIDIGMDVHQAEGCPPRMAGQVILSLPGSPCMKCMGFLTDEKLSQEGEKYGDAGVNPQVVWPNGVLASTAVGIAVDLLSNWTGQYRGPIYLSYIGNDFTISPHVRLRYLPSEPCSHYPTSAVGDPLL